MAIGGGTLDTRNLVNALAGLAWFFSAFKD
jgi:hypothetical protein